MYFCSDSSHHASRRTANQGGAFALYSMRYTKLPLDYPDILAMLKERGLIIHDDDKAISCLRVISYFRLANYFHPMEADKVNHIFKPNSFFDNAVDLYEFDRELRSLIFSAIQAVETALRSKMIHHIILESWVKCAVVMRNYLAHHSRVWNRSFPIIPQTNARFRGRWITCRVGNDSKLYLHLCYLKYMLDSIKSNNHFAADLKELLLKHPNVDVLAMGFPMGWQEETLWR